MDWLSCMGALALMRPPLPSNLIDKLLRTVTLCSARLLLNICSVCRWCTFWILQGLFWGQVTLRTKISRFKYSLLKDNYQSQFYISFEIICLSLWLNNSDSACHKLKTSAVPNIELNTVWMWSVTGSCNKMIMTQNYSLICTILVVWWYIEARFWYLRQLWGQCSLWVGR